MNNARQPEREVVEAAEAGKLEARLRRSIEAGKAKDALALLRELEALGKASSSQLVVTTYLLAVVRSAPLAAQEASGDLIGIARDVVDVVEPWFARDLENFAEVAEGGRHAALHALMHVAAGAGKLDQALTIRALDQAGNARCARRWASEGIETSPGCHAHYPNAYGNAQLVGHLVEAGQFADVPGLLDLLAALTGMETGIEAESRDAFGEEEVGALDLVLASQAPGDLVSRCKKRLAVIAAGAEPEGLWPRTRARLAAASR